MAKRFTDTEKFIDPWYRRLSSKHKLLWEYLLCACDHAGIINLDLEFVEMVLGEKFDDNVIEKFFSDRVIRLSEYKLFIPKFIDFQYGALNPESKIHSSVMARLEHEGIICSTLKSGRSYTLSIAYDNTYLSVKDKDKDKDKEKEKNKEKEERCEKILEKHNLITGKKYSLTPANLKHIRARISEGYTDQDFEAVSKFKKQEWLGTPMSKFLRPETIFGGKFDGYLQDSKGQEPEVFTTEEEAGKFLQSIGML